jgi:hypothetical protein
LSHVTETLEGQTHDVAPSALAPGLVEFFLPASGGA